MTATCIGAHTEDPPLAEPGSMLCRRCRTQLARDLETIRIEICHKIDLIQPGNGTGGTCHTKPGSKSPARDELIAALDVRSKQTRDLVPVAAVVDTWCRIVVEERRLSTAPSDTVEAVGLLERHADWIAAQHWADEIFIELHDAAWQMRRLANDLPPPRIGTCRAADDPYKPGQECGGPLQWIDDTASVQCARCKDHWSTADLMGMARVVDIWLPTSTISELLGVPMRTLQHWTQGGQVRRQRHGVICYTDALKHTEGAT